ncbi:MAG TPA: hypothetical protein VG796_02585 [Verrucomicrobiales bacterium]|nr:hypothetical protein [Verrucomicrobiales bacterium]
MKTKMINAFAAGAGFLGGWLWLQADHSAHTEKVREPNFPTPELRPKSTFQGEVNRQDKASIAACNARSGCK